MYIYYKEQGETFVMLHKIIKFSCMIITCAYIHVFPKQIHSGNQKNLMSYLLKVWV